MSREARACIGWHIDSLPKAAEQVIYRSSKGKNCLKSHIYGFHHGQRSSLVLFRMTKRGIQEEDVRGSKRLALAYYAAQLPSLLQTLLS